MKNGMKIWGMRVLALVGLITIVGFIWPVFQPQKEEQSQSPAVQLVYAAKSRITPSAPTSSWPEVDQLQNEADRLRALGQARTSYTAIWSKATTWPEAEWQTNLSPVIRYEGPDIIMDQTSDGSGSSILILSGGSLKVEAVDHEGNPQLHDLFAQLPHGWKLLYWDVTAETRADYTTVIRDDSLPTELVPISQRTSNGQAYITRRFAYREDVFWPGEAVSLANWDRIKLRNSSEDMGQREIIDRYGVVLTRGQGSDYLNYVPEPLADWEKEGGYYRSWRIRCKDPEATIRLLVNDDWYVVKSNTDVNTQESENVDGSIRLRVILCRNSKHREVPVEFVYYRALPKTISL